MRFKNFADAPLTVPFQRWSHPSGGRIALDLTLPAGYLTEELDPDDPIVQLMLKAHPELRPIVVRNAWQRILEGVL